MKCPLCNEDLFEIYGLLMCVNEACPYRYSKPNPADAVRESGVDATTTGLSGKEV